MLPEASTTKMTREPALRAIFLARTSLCSMYTPFFLAGLATFSPLASAASSLAMAAFCRSRRFIW